MERTVPSTASEEVELYLRTYYSLLRSTAEVHIRSLEEVHSGMRSLLHPGARDFTPDMGGFIYSLLRLPAEIHQTNLVILGQSSEVFVREGFTDIETWAEVAASARRRRCYYDGQGTLACIIASRSDIDDVIPILTAYQMEWNKFHTLLHNYVPPGDGSLADIQTDPAIMQGLAANLRLSLDDLERLHTIWGADFGAYLELMRKNTKELRVRLLSGSLSEYRRATNLWWEQIEQDFPEITRRPLYFISSNTHSMVNLLSGFARFREDDLVNYLEEAEHCELLEEWQGILENNVTSSRENFLYYVLKKYQATPAGQKLMQEQRRVEQAHGILRVSSQHSFDVEAQVVELNKLDAGKLDPRLGGGEDPSLPDLSYLSNSDALILNIDYPLGLAAYHILSEVSDQAGEVLGVYVMGKAASLNSAIGDIVIPNVVHDEHSQNTYLFSTCFQAADVSPDLMYGTVFDNQKAVTVRGTFLQNATYMDVFYREGYTDIEMEAGSYLSAVYEMYRPKRHPTNEIVTLYGLPFDLGIIHYVSDNPLSKGKNLGAGSLSYYGMDSTYAASVAVLRRILSLEKQRLSR